MRMFPNRNCKNRASVNPTTLCNICNFRSHDTVSDQIVRQERFTEAISYDPCDEMILPSELSIMKID